MKFAGLSLPETKIDTRLKKIAGPGGWGEFHQHFKCSFLQIPKVLKDTDELAAFFALMGFAHLKAGCKHVDEINPKLPLR